MAESKQAVQLLKTKDVARRLSCSAWQVKQLVEAGELRSLRIGVRSIRFEPADLEQYIKHKKGEQ